MSTLELNHPVPPTAVPSMRSEALAAARSLDRWGSARGWRGADPYDGLNATRFPRRLGQSPLPLRILTQAVKRFPLDLRPVLGIPPGLSAATLAHVISAYARNGFIDEVEAHVKLRGRIVQLEQLRCDGFREPCWGYHFDVQTRVFFYPRSAPNTIATAFAGLALLDAYELAHIQEGLELASAVGDFFINYVPQTSSEPGAYFGYLVGDTTPIHNANMLISALLARLYKLTGRDDFKQAASKGLEYTISRQKPDGSWPYGELPHLGWVDGFHTGYVLDSVLTCVESGVGVATGEAAWRRGLRFFVTALIEAGGTPRYTPASRYPVDGQCVAQAIQTLSRAAEREPDLAARRWSVLRFALDHFARHDGAFYFQRERFWTNRIAHPRWVQSPMLEALATTLHYK